MLDEMDECDHLFLKKKEDECDLAVNIKDLLLQKRYL